MAGTEAWPDLAFRITPDFRLIRMACAVRQNGQMDSEASPAAFNLAGFDGVRRVWTLSGR